MTLKKKIFGSLFILICLGLVVGGYFWWKGGSEKELTSEDLSANLLELDLINSPLNQLKIPEMDLNIPTDFGNINLEIPDLSGRDFINIKTPETEVDISGVSGGIDIEAMKESGAAPPADWEPDEATCNQFKAAPSCSFVPEQYRDLCNKCKAKGY